MSPNDQTTREDGEALASVLFRPMSQKPVACPQSLTCCTAPVNPGKRGLARPQHRINWLAPFSCATHAVLFFAGHRSQSVLFGRSRAPTPSLILDPLKGRQRFLCCSTPVAFVSNSLFEKRFHFWALQLHLIHWNTTDFGSLEDALAQPGGVAIVAIFIQVRRAAALLTVCRSLLVKP